MAYTVDEAKALVIKAGFELIEKGLIARTWGNVSARISDTQFVITPSGIPYEDLTPDKIVVVNIADCEYEGDVKPSSEKGVHADAYRLRSDVNFVIHTHQTAASVASIRKDNIKVEADLAGVIGPVVPIAKYGISSTQTLRENVAATVEAFVNSKVVLMKHHGAVCMGADYDEAFAVADALEKACEAAITKVIKEKGGEDKTYEDLASVFTDVVVADADKAIALQDLGSSKKNEDGSFVLTMNDGASYECTPYGNGKTGIVPRCALIHANIYKNTDVKFISQYAAPEAVAVSKEGVSEPLYFDDFVQIAGFNVKNCGWDISSYRKQAVEIGKAAVGTNAVFVKGQGALCTANNEFDAKAVEMVLEKECRAHLLAGLVEDAGTVAIIGGVLERVVYVMKYSKQADK